MTIPPALIAALKRPVVLIGVGVAVLLVIVWLLVFFVPQGHKLTTLQTEKVSLEQQVAQDEARVAQVRKESQHVGQIQEMYSTLAGYVPAEEDLYTYIQTLSNAANSSGVTITSLVPSALQSVSGTSYSAVPISATIKGTYDHVLAFIKAVYALPRLTDINGVEISGGGPQSNRSTPLSVNLQLAIFTSQKPTAAQS